METHNIFFLSEFEKDLYESAAIRLGISITELVKHARRICLDPVLVEGPRVRFPETCLVDCVPAPSVNIDLGEAWAQMHADDAACEYLLREKPSMDNVLKVMANQLAWMRFCAARCERAEDRDVYRTLTAFREATIRALIARGRTKRGGEEVTELLEEMLEVVR
jgi:hypothetical protein